QGAAGGSAVAIRYDLWFWAQLPAIKVNAFFNATKFYSFYQTIDTNNSFLGWGLDSYNETVREQMIQSESMTFDYDWGGVTDEKIRGPIRDWAFTTLAAAVEREMVDNITPLSDDQRKRPDGFDNVKRDIANTKITNVTLRFKEAQTVEWNVVPQ